MRPATVYRAYDAEGNLLYIGMTTQNVGRMTQHARDSGWWPRTVRLELEHLPSREEALRRERQLINALRPEANDPMIRTWDERWADIEQRRLDGAPWSVIAREYGVTVRTLKETKQRRKVAAQRRAALQ
jgi:predicted GIY-YIG superfamily endonuclease